MKRNWVLIAAVLVLLCAAIVNRVSVQYKQGVTKTSEEVDKEWEAMSALIKDDIKEEANYKAIRAQAESVDARVIWESDSTNLLRWFDDQAKRLNLHLANSRLVPHRSRRATVGSEAFRPMRFELELKGNYRALATYVENVERAPYAFLIEKLTTTALRNEFGVGDLQVTVLCLMPEGMSASKNDGEGS